MATTDVRSRVRRKASSKFKLVVHLAAPHWIATYRTRRACAVAVERAARFGYWQSAAQDRFAGFLSEDWLVGHGSPPRMAVPVHAQRMLQTKGNPDGTRAETRSPQGSYIGRSPGLRSARRRDAGKLTATGLACTLCRSSCRAGGSNGYIEEELRNNFGVSRDDFLTALNAIESRGHRGWPTTSA